MVCLLFSGLVVGLPGQDSGTKKYRLFGIARTTQVSYEIVKTAPSAARLMLR